jgi:hypothetical protein
MATAKKVATKAAMNPKVKTSERKNKIGAEINALRDQRAALKAVAVPTAVVAPAAPKGKPAAKPAAKAAAPAKKAAKRVAKK